MIEPIIRRATESDAGQIAAVLLRSFADFRPLYTAGGFSATTPDALVVRARLEEGPTWVAVQKGVVGTVSAVKTGADLYVRSMAVLPAMRGQGLAEKLLHVVEKYAYQQRVDRLVLSTTPFPHTAIRLYERNGFVRIDDEPHELFGTPLFTMAKPL